MLERVWKKGNPPTLLVGIEPDIATMENSIRVCVCVCVYVCLCVLSRGWLSATPWTIACQAPLSIGFSR